MNASGGHLAPAADERERWTPGARSASPWQFRHALFHAGIGQGARGRQVFSRAWL